MATVIDFKPKVKSITTQHSGSSAIPKPANDSTVAQNDAFGFSGDMKTFELIRKLLSISSEIETDEEQNPVNIQSVLQAYNFLMNFELEAYKKPDILVDPDGSVTFEFLPLEGFHSFLISFSGLDYIHYAGIYLDGGECHGREYFNGTDIPDSVYFNINRI